jgi:outer membrane lipoprotein-sorting protein
MQALVLCLCAMLSTATDNAQAGDLVRRCYEALQAVKSLDCTVEVKSQFDPEGSKGVTRTESYHVVYSPPKKIAVRLVDVQVTGGSAEARKAEAFPMYAREIISDGSRYYVLNPSSTRYMLHPLGSGGIAKETQGAGCFQDFTMGDMLFNKEKSYIQEAAKSGKVLGKETIHGVSCQKVEFGSSSDRNTLWIGSTDHILRKVETRSEGMRITEVYRGVRVNGPVNPSAFKIAPPKRAIRVEKL